ncbi:xanthine dehydrogenase family protein subunit M [Aquamicrobium sp. LC103]|uniref:FAD binding domain-containing protein n=1 Tax=Aquamicrobium sp. LC103 TaxID=1120658 RepID=UPI00063E9C98|nr:xanthine dehydrogenase family protein subunit M [Aquamicrobium sp. LC103]TKT80261.1 xanthine dehydrogenase family protein subunit M [Aquamicrobium sp. LC103]
MRYARPKSLDEAVALLGEDHWRVLAGGTDFYPVQGARPFRENILDINGLAELRAIGRTGTHFVFGARASWTDIIRHDLPRAFDALKLAAREVGSIQIQNSGTIAGNLCNASPAADGVPPLLALDAEVEIRSVAGGRLVRLADFVLGNRRTALEPGELVTAVRVPTASAGGSSHFVKLGARRYLVISIAMAAARISVDAEGTVRELALSVGSCSPAALRFPELEGRLVGRHADASLVEAVAGWPFEELRPIDDVRATAEYRREAAREIAARALRGALATAGTAFERAGGVAA